MGYGLFQWVYLQDNEFSHPLCSLEATGNKYLHPVGYPPKESLNNCHVTLMGQGLHCMCPAMKPKHTPVNPQGQQTWKCRFSCMAAWPPLLTNLLAKHEGGWETCVCSLFSYATISSSFVLASYIVLGTTLGPAIIWSSN